MQTAEGSRKSTLDSLPPISTALWRRRTRINSGGIPLNAIDILRGHEREMKERFAVRRIGLFGSHARGEAGPESDVDILVEFEKPTFDNFMDLAFFLEDLFQRKVELVTPSGLSPCIRPRVEREVIWAG